MLLLFSSHERAAQHSIASDFLAELTFLQFLSISFSNLIFLKCSIYWWQAGFLLNNSEHLLSRLSQTCMCVILILSWLLFVSFTLENGSISHSLLLGFNLLHPVIKIQLLLCIQMMYFILLYFVCTNDGNFSCQKRLPV